MAATGRHLSALDPSSAAIDNDYYSEIGDSWWDPEGPLRALHDMNPARVRYFDTTVRARLGEDRSAVRVLDIGCGGGLMSERLAELGYTVTGLDLSEGSVETARAHARTTGVEVTYRVGSAYELPAEDGSLDAVLLSDVLEHLHDLPGAVAECARVLRPGGVLVFDTINRTAASYLMAILVLERLLKIIHPGTHNWRMFIRPRELHAVLARHGLTPARPRGLAPTAPRHRLLAAIARRRPLGEFGPTSSTAVSYIGHAVKSGPAGSGSAATSTDKPRRAQP
ncbi:MULTISPECIES: bifunctional 2-polyprenyl-6-hydroxyphenol methylase/3-demethylubiquinol 3-O-methyltransferase UbiG [unclassified Streptomyces]|uniref:bifunctional 2-polyprenyl-6-hydroxyphenol methylase/3-demethylubiquinol 3-O-methyltransferase UbiG n=1 Tax=unclassified Streptomyces TaxID=2593676 RepID=UPI002DDAFE54|nr:MULTISPECIES: bifunctional 2-polyprenyl-6-hydroxyphenol methylase/3-demethylubiquinol 3-O-methyltransferase UbiG [unclassified Streptomyces]WSA95495.1 bifunctional 2-polyprenyl-6-hydroxyphenol methylase/3-demethylubiquinol 3-O-methyltransferase UbiG [Streptomyces sp. NBC_01795]WSB79911.1 bifunctional 2-polyprenyl-6-hydroxyphenol methylase/3-demethylubiquinol 3-O-methyltransferase UbiG [Streptomyces sp. NBC_01775]WSS40596.1 bifunctional 2-polyprenyl-6-hydroxyphenol methylase/3-demethylubiquino